MIAFKIKMAYKSFDTNQLTRLQSGYDGIDHVSIEYYFFLKTMEARLIKFWVLLFLRQHKSE